MSGFGKSGILNRAVRVAVGGTAVAVMAAGGIASAQPATRPSTRPVASAWKPADAPLMTRFAADVDPAAPLPEYPRPQLRRDDWRNLNGLWDYAVAAKDDPDPADIDGQILVPFPIESALSGVGREFLPDQALWYRRTFEVPADWAGRRTVLHFGAVDYACEALVNGTSVGTHTGGYDPFSFDVTDALNADGSQELVLRVTDPTIAAGQPRGKQTLRPEGIMYTPTSGIWQTVWIEPVAPGGVADLKIVPDVDVDAGTAALRVTADASDGGDPGATVTVTLKDGGRTVGTAQGEPGDEVTIPVPDAHLWTPDDPHLYDLTVAVESGGRPVDAVESYAGLRKIEVADVGGVKKMLLNGKFVFQFGPLDQGFWPDGLYTAPTDAALRSDLEAIKGFGFNMVRKHIKVEPARWYYHADTLGVLVWLDMPSANSYLAPDQPRPEVDKPEYASELTRIVESLRDHPSIVMWVIFNEGQGQHDTPELVDMVKKLDPTRLVNQASGGEHKGAGDVFDVHSYPPPACPSPNDTMALACGEYGGIGMRIPEHMWSKEGWGYGGASNTPESVEGKYAEYANLLKTFRDDRGLSAAVYTQLTDVEIEVNGLLTYDRVQKVDPAWIARATRFEWAGPTYQPLVPTSQAESQAWSYTFDQPSAEWATPDFDASSWPTGPGGFGTAKTPGIGVLGTTWDTPQVWLRRTFNPGPLTPEQLGQLVLTDYHDEGVEVYLNGVLAYKSDGHVTGYENADLTPEARAAIKPDAENVMAVTCRQTIGGQYVDVGLGVRQRNR